MLYVFTSFELGWANITGKKIHPSLLSAWCSSDLIHMLFLQDYPPSKQYVVTRKH